MKKNIFFLSTFLCAGAFVVQTNAQTAAEIECAKTKHQQPGYWIVRDKIFAFPKLGIGGTGKSTTASPIRLTQLKTIEQLIRDVIPQPIGANACITAWDVSWERDGAKNEDAYSYEQVQKLKRPGGTRVWVQFGRNKCGENGKPLNYWPAESNYADDELSLYINTNSVDNPWFFKSEVLTNPECKRRNELPMFYTIPPHDNFQIKLNEKKRMAGQFPNKTINAITENYFVFREIKTVEYGFSSGINSNSIKEDVIMTYNNKLPFTFMTRGQLLDYVKKAFTINSEELISRLKIETERLTKLNNPKSNQSTIDSYNKTIADEPAKLVEFFGWLDKIKAHYQNSLQLPATFKRYTPDIIHSVLMDLYYLKKDYNNIFEDEPTKGYTQAVYDPSFFKSKKAEDIQLISVCWQYDYEDSMYPNTNKQEAEKELTRCKSLHTAMSQKFDWSKLASLLIK
jgi:hypothetical protein